MPRNTSFSFYRPGAGLRTDLENLLAKFVEAESVRYEDFVKVWRQMKFYQVYYGRQTERLLTEFTEQCFKLTVEYWMTTYNFQIRTGALYALYALYYTQPGSRKTKIRITPLQWTNIQAFMVDVKRQQHLDMEFIFRKLMREHAFMFVAFSDQMYPDLHEFTELGEKDDTFQYEMSVLPELFEPDNISQLSSIHEKYHQMKCMLSANDEPDPSLDIIHPSVVQYITKEVAKHEEFRKTGGVVQKKRRGGETSDSEMDSDFEPSQSRVAIGSRRASLKAKAFSTAGGVIKSRRHRETVKHTDESSSSPSKSSKRKKGSPKSKLKSPKSKNQQSDEVEEETMKALSDEATPSTVSLGDTLRNAFLSMPKLTPDDDTEGKGMTRKSVIQRNYTVVKKVQQSPKKPSSKSPSKPAKKKPDKRKKARKRTKTSK